MASSLVLACGVLETTSPLSARATCGSAKLKAAVTRAQARIARSSGRSTITSTILLPAVVIVGGRDEGGDARAKYSGVFVGVPLPSARGQGLCADAAADGGEGDGGTGGAAAAACGDVGGPAATPPAEGGVAAGG